MNLPFHFSMGGSHISILIIESAVGLRSSCSRQCSGIIAGGRGGVLAASAFAPPPPRGAPAAPPRAGPPARAGAGPSGTIAALVIVALSNLRLVRLSQVAADPAALRS